MKKILTIIILIFLFNEVEAQKRYVVKLKESGVATTRGETGDRDSNNNRGKISRDQKLKKVNDVAKGKGVTKLISFFADAEVGFVAELTDVQRQSLLNDPYVQSVLEDFKMQSRPRMQSKPRMQSRPRMQEEYSYDIDQGTSCAVIQSMGPVKVNGSRKESIWVVDSGIDSRHQDLRVDKKYSKSFVDSNPLSDKVGHGTHIAGIAAADGKGNPSQFRMSGVAEGANLISLKVLDANGEGFWSDIIGALDHVAKFGIKGDVVIMSLGSFNVANCENSNIQLKEAIENVAKLGVFVVMSAGNDSGDAMLNSPGCINGPNIITVGSVDSNCTDGVIGCSSFSNFGANVDWVAPGNPIFSTFPTNDYMMMSGTSMANALVAGIIFASNGNPAVMQTITCNGRTYSIPKVR